MEVRYFLDVSESDSEGVQKHWNEAELGLKASLSDVVSEPNNDESVGYNPNSRTDHGQRVVVVITLAQGRWDREVLGPSQRHEDYVLYVVSHFATSRETNRESLFVDGLVNQLVNYALWYTLRLAHHSLLQKDLLPVEFLLLFLVKEFRVI